jgi:hypothetical protein
MPTQDDRKDTDQRRPYVPPRIEAEEDLAAESLLHFAPAGPVPDETACEFSGCQG